MKTLSKQIIEYGGEIKPLDLKIFNRPLHGYFNPSIFNDQGSLYLNLRSCDYTIFHSEKGSTFLYNNSLNYFGVEGKSTFTTKNYFAYISTKYLKPEFGCVVVTDEFDKEPQWRFTGLEDARLVKWDGKFYLCGTRRDTESTGIGRMELSEIVVEHAYSKEVKRYRIPTPGDDSSYCEKNWMPIVSKPYHFVKWTNPTEVVKYDINTNKCQTVVLKEESDKLSNNLRGGSQIIDWGEEHYLGIVHQSYHSYDDQNRFDNEYKQQFILWDSEWNIVKYSPQFSVMGAKIEFISSLTICYGDVIITFGHQDNSSYILRVSQNFVEEILNG